MTSNETDEAVFLRLRQQYIATDQTERGIRCTSAWEDSNVDGKQCFVRQAPRLSDKALLAINV